MWHDVTRPEQNPKNWYLSQTGYHWTLWLELHFLQLILAIEGGKFLVAQFPLVLRFLSFFVSQAWKISKNVLHANKSGIFNLQTRKTVCLRKKTTLQIKKITKKPSSNNLSMLILGQKISILNLQAIGNSSFSQVPDLGPKKSSVTHPVDRGYYFQPVSGAARASSAGGITFQKKSIWGVDSARILQEYPHKYEGFLKCWYPTTFGFPTEHDYFEVFWGVYGRFP